jgi:hypothetical protein
MLILALDGRATLSKGCTKNKGEMGFCLEAILQTDPKLRTERLLTTIGFSPIGSSECNGHAVAGLASLSARKVSGVVSPGPFHYSA